ncbi:11976_t:CDS:1, partial [Cetraspora pellucida]
NKSEDDLLESDEDELVKSNKDKLTKSDDENIKVPESKIDLLTKSNVNSEN